MERKYKVKEILKDKASINNLLNNSYSLKDLVDNVDEIKVLELVNHEFDNSLKQLANEILNKSIRFYLDQVNGLENLFVSDLNNFVAELDYNKIYYSIKYNGITFFNLPDTKVSSVEYMGYDIYLNGADLIKTIKSHSFFKNKIVALVNKNDTRHYLLAADKVVRLMLHIKPNKNDFRDDIIYTLTHEAVHYLTIPFVCSFLIKNFGLNVPKLKELSLTESLFETIAYAAGTILFNKYAKKNVKPTRFTSNKVKGVKEAEDLLGLSNGSLKVCHETFCKNYLEKAF